MHQTLYGDIVYSPNPGSPRAIPGRPSLPRGAVSERGGFLLADQHGKARGGRFFIFETWNDYAAACCGSSAVGAAHCGLVDIELRRVARKILGPDSMEPDSETDNCDRDLISAFPGVY